MPVSYCPKCGKPVPWRNQRGSKAPKECPGCGFSPISRWKCKLCHDSGILLNQPQVDGEYQRCEHPLMPAIFRRE